MGCSRLRLYFILVFAPYHCIINTGDGTNVRVNVCIKLNVIAGYSFRKWVFCSSSVVIVRIQREKCKDCLYFYYLLSAYSVHFCCFRNKSIGTNVQMRFYRIIRPLHLVWSCIIFHKIFMYLVPLVVMRSYACSDSYCDEDTCTDRLLLIINWRGISVFGVEVCAGSDLALRRWKITVSPQKSAMLCWPFYITNLVSQIMRGLCCWRTEDVKYTYRNLKRSIFVFHMKMEQV